MKASTLPSYFNRNQDVFYDLNAAALLPARCNVQRVHGLQKTSSTHKQNVSIFISTFKNLNLCDNSNVERYRRRVFTASEFGDGVLRSANQTQSGLSRARQQTQLLTIMEAFPAARCQNAENKTRMNKQSQHNANGRTPNVVSIPEDTNASADRRNTTIESEFSFLFLSFHFRS